MKEEINVGGKKFWILVEPHAIDSDKGDQLKEYFTASYATEEPPTLPGGILLLNEDKTPKRFDSPVEALEYASEKLTAGVNGYH